MDWQSLRFMLPMESAAAIIVTTRDRDLHKHIRLEYPGLNLEHLSLEKFTEQEALALFCGMLANEYRQAEDALYLEIAESLGFLPIALRQAISLMLFGAHYTAVELRDKLAKEDRLELLRSGAAVEGSDCRIIETVFDLSSSLLTQELLDALQYLAVCAPGPAPLDFLQCISGQQNTAERLERLYEYSWCERREQAGRRFYELHQLVRELVKRRFLDPHSDEFIALVHEIFTSEDEHFSKKDELFPQLQEAFSLATEQKDERLKIWLYPLGIFCSSRGYGGFYIRLTQDVERLFPDDRMALGWAYVNRAGLAICWWNQGIIYSQQGDRAKQIALMQKSIAAKKAMGIPTEKDEEEVKKVRR